METNPTENPPNRDVWKQKAHAVYEKLPRNRLYALDDIGLQSFAALAASWYERFVAEQSSLGKPTSHSLEQLVPTFQELSVYVPSMLQQRPAAEPSAPKVWVDPFSGEPARNPWAEPVDLTSQSVIATLDPALAAHLKQSAHGVSYSFLAKARSEAEGRAKVRDLPYGPEEHRKNPLVRPVQQQSTVAHLFPGRRH